MDLILREEWGLSPLEEKEMLAEGGLTLRELWELLELIEKVVKKIEKYWPPLKDGFIVGWENG